MTYIFLTLSIILNIFFVWYTRKLLLNLLYVSDNITSTLDKLDKFSGHLKSIHELETFYGEPVLQDLIRHSKQVVEDIEEYKEIYTLFEAEEDLEEFEEEKENG